MLIVARFCLRSCADINLPDVLYRKCCLKTTEGDWRTDSMERYCYKSTISSKLHDTLL